jgi:hypothetical protein
MRRPRPASREAELNGIAPSLLGRFVRQLELGNLYRSRPEELDFRADNGVLSTALAITVMKKKNVQRKVVVLLMERGAELPYPAKWIAVARLPSLTTARP